MRRSLAIIGVVFMIVSISLGALGAHFLVDKLSAERLAGFKTGVLYLMIHGLALLVFGLIDNRVSNTRLWGCRLLWIGAACFSGSIFLLTTQDLLALSGKVSWLGPVTPLGGILMISGWAIILLSLMGKEKK
jgi:uncharacterized membrane protein YgdD (TMEM256/DUF423 family)